jgi:2-polyprenyl-3-methyl-5-hydroxy-6-metoxy-1,4-benzoquinol methylase
MKAVLRALLRPFPRAKGWLRAMASRLGLVSSVSANYRLIDNQLIPDETERLRNSWQDMGMPLRQRALVDRQLADYRQGQAVDVFDVFVAAIQATALNKGSLLEVGCSSGYYSDVLAIKQLDFAYTGCDYSSAFIELARSKHPGLPFYVGDATQLSFQDNEFDIVVSGCCLLHISEFDKGIAETARVASRWAIFHRTPVLHGRPNQYYHKQAYGVETIEIHFNEAELLASFAHHGLELLRTITLDESGDAGGKGAVLSIRTYVCRKTGNA